MRHISEQIEIAGGSQLQGQVRAPPSKSQTHRALIAASLSPEESKIAMPLVCEDTQATIAAVKSYGAKISSEDELLTVTGPEHIETPEDIVDCRESASTIRFVTPILSHAEGLSILTGGPSLRKRPMKPLIDSLGHLGVKCYSTHGDGHPPLVVFGGTYRGGETRIPGDVSSQFISGLLFSASLATEKTSIQVATALESAPYVKMTIEILREHGVRVDADADFTSFAVRERQRVKPCDHIIEGDYSSAAFLLAAGAITRSPICVSRLRTSGSTQGDKEILSILRQMGVDMDVQSESVWIRSANLRAAEIDAKDCPDLVPPVAAMACYAAGVTRIRNARRLKMKESNRLATLSCELRKMGASIQETDDGLEIADVGSLKGTNVASYDDHRVAMACSVAALGAKGVTTVHRAECVTKSYPAFFDDLKSLGADIIGR